MEGDEKNEGVEEGIEGVGCRTVGGLEGDRSSSNQLSAFIH